MRVLALAATTAALLVCLLASTTAGASALKVSRPAAGDLSVAHVTFTVKPSRGARLNRLGAPSITNRSALASSLTVVGGVKKTARPGTLLATVVVVRRSDGPSGAPNVSLRL